VSNKRVALQGHFSNDPSNTFCDDQTGMFDAETWGEGNTTDFSAQLRMREIPLVHY